MAIDFDDRVGNVSENSEDNEEEDSVTYLGLFWESHLAILFAEMASELTRNLLPDEINSKEEHEQYLKVNKNK